MLEEQVAMYRGIFDSAHDASVQAVEITGQSDVFLSESGENPCFYRLRRALTRIEQVNTGDSPVVCTP